MSWGVSSLLTAVKSIQGQSNCCPNGTSTTQKVFVIKDSRSYRLACFCVLFRCFLFFFCCSRLACIVSCLGSACACRRFGNLAKAFAFSAGSSEVQQACTICSRIDLRAATLIVVNVCGCSDITAGARSSASSACNTAYMYSGCMAT